MDGEYAELEVEASWHSDSECLVGKSADFKKLFYFLF